MRHWIQSIILFLACLFFICSTLVYFQWKRFLNTPLNQGDRPYLIQVKAGQSLRQVAFELEKQKRLSSPRFFTWLAHLKDASHRIQAGDYLVSPGVTPDQLIEKMISGEVILHRLTIVDGWTFERVLHRIKANPYLTHTLDGLSVAAIIEKLGIKESSPEGQFFPDTYLFRQGAVDIEMLRKAHKKMQSVLEIAWKNRDHTVPYKTPQEALIVASLIQKETGLSDEYSKVSSVIRNRLKLNMPLQVDPTVIYGLGKKYRYPLTQKQLLRDTPYNTYTRKGLPPTPIAMVNIKALYAALHPESSGVLYFVANGKGGHTFSDHYDTHRLAVNSYRKEQKEKKFPRILMGEICIWVLGFAAYDQK